MKIEPRVWIARIGGLFGRKRRERELADDVRTHLEMAIEENIRKGLSPNDAESQARREFGGIEQMKERLRDQRGIPLLDGLGREFRLALRSLVRRPGFALIGVVTLGLGIGVNTAVFSLVDSVLIAPLPYPDGDRLATVWQDLTEIGFDRVETTSADFLDWRAESEVFEDMAGYFFGAFNMTGDGPPERYGGFEVTPNLLEVLDVEPGLGRGFLDSEGDPANFENVVILSHALWQERFGADADVLGRSLTMNGRPYEVVGVMPPGFQFPNKDVRLWTPFAPNPDNRVTFFMQVVGRLRRGSTAAEAQAEMNTIAARLSETYPNSNGRRDSVVVLPLRDQFVEGQRRSLVLLLAASGLVLLVASANVAGLVITRGMGRTREIEVRSALGAGRAQIARQLLVEGLTLSLAGAALGASIAVGAFRYLETLVPAALRGAVAPEVNLRFMAFTLAISLVSGLAFGLVPLRRMFHAAGHGATRVRTIGSLPERFRAVLVSAEVALALMVVVSTGLVVRTLENLESVDPGFRAENVLTARLEQFRAGETIANRRRFFDEVVERIESQPGVVRAGFTSSLPYTMQMGGNTFFLEDRPDIPSELSVAYRIEVTPGFRSAMGLPLLAGRDFDARDDQNGTRSVIVSEYIANLLGGDAVGRRLGFPTLDGVPLWVEIVGVVGEARQDGLDQPSRRAVTYLPVSQAEQLWYFTPRDLVVRTVGDPAILTAALREQVWAVDSDQSISNVQTLEALLDMQIVEERTLAVLFSTFSGLALFLAGLGVYGLMAFTVATRSKEFGLRMALGAERRDLAHAVLRDAMLWLGSGLATGLLLTRIVSQSMESLLYEVEPLDAVSLAAAVVALCAAGVAAALVPVWRATRVGPLAALRHE